MNYIDGGVCAASGFKAAGKHCGIRRNKSKKDLALIVSERPASAACVYTQNLVKGAPLLVTKQNLSNGQAQAIICNSGNANTCNADGIQIAEEMCKDTAQALGLAPSDIVVASTGVIGEPLDIAPIKAGIPALAGSLGANSLHAAQAIMTTDTIAKEVAVEIELDGKPCKIGGIAKGSGMIHPNMATMLVFITADAAITPQMLQKAVSEDVQDTFNMISIDGDTSTNDIVCVLANGAAGNAVISEPGADYQRFAEALHAVTKALCKLIAGDGEGATKLIVCKTTGASTQEAARKAAKSVICSSLFKAAMFGSDANWGRVLCALGYSGAELDVTKIDVSFASKAGELSVCKGGAGVPFSEETAKQILLEDEINVLISLGDGAYSAEAYGCDLTYDYVKINGDYRT